jgi:hypothetical protein
MTTVRKSIRIATEDAAKVENFKPVTDVFISPYVAPGLPKYVSMPAIKDFGLNGFHYKTLKSKV